MGDGVAYAARGPYFRPAQVHNPSLLSVVAQFLSCRAAFYSNLRHQGCLRTDSSKVGLTIQDSLVDQLDT